MLNLTYNTLNILVAFLTYNDQNQILFLLDNDVWHLLLQFTLALKHLHLFIVHLLAPEQFSNNNYSSLVRINIVIRRYTPLKLLFSMTGFVWLLYTMADQISHCVK